jgi:hypothetical protein
MTKVKTNDIKKGTKIRLVDGIEATMQDNMKGNIRLIMVVTPQGEDWGSTYAHKIKQAFVNGEWADVELTHDQLKLRNALDALGL